MNKDEAQKERDQIREHLLKSNPNDKIYAYPFEDPQDLLDLLDEMEREVKQDSTDEKELAFNDLLILLNSQLYGEGVGEDIDVDVEVYDKVHESLDKRKDELKQLLRTLTQKNRKEYYRQLSSRDKYFIDSEGRLFISSNVCVDKDGIIYEIKIS